MVLGEDMNMGASIWNVQHDEEGQFSPPDDVIEDEAAIGIEEDVLILASRLTKGAKDRGELFVVGPTGIGKTTLAKNVFKHSEIVSRFPTRAWITLPRDFAQVDILQVIAEQLLGKSSEIEFEAKMEELKRRAYNLLRCTRYLIVLDDVRTFEAWNFVTSFFPNTSNGSHLLISTTNRELAQFSKKHSAFTDIHEIRLLSYEESLELFNSKVAIPVELEQLGKGIVKKCMGLPGTILSTAQLLLGKEATREHWFTVLKQIDEKQASLNLKLNLLASNLPPHLKRCLYCLGLFHNDYDIPVRRLIALWVAEGLVQLQQDDKNSPEYIAEKYLSELINLELIQVDRMKPNGRVRTCRMHYFLKDQMVKKAREASFIQNPGEENSSDASSDKGKLYRLADHLDTTENSFPHIHGEKFRSPILRSYYRDICSFLSFDFREGPIPGEEIGNFLRRGIAAKCFKHLCVLDLEGVFRPKLPKEIGKLIELRYLGLRWTYLEFLPSSIGKLLNLQTLDLKHTYISNLPSSLWKMQRLRHLYLSDSYRSRFFAPPSKSSLIELQTLWGAFVDEESTVNGGLNRLTHLRKLGLVCRLSVQQQKSLSKWIASLSRLESLRLKSIDDCVQPSDLYLENLSASKNLSNVYLLGRLVIPSVMHTFPESVTEITLSISGLTENPMQALEKLPNLRILGLLSGSYLGKVMYCSKGGFPLLRVLKLWKLEELEEWCVEKGAMSIVKEIEIRCCKRLKFLHEGLQNLVHCHVLKLKSISEELQARVIKNQGQDWYKISHIPDVRVEN